jgi:hypothetical protein
MWISCAYVPRKARSLSSSISMAATHAPAPTLPPTSVLDSRRSLRRSNTHSCLSRAVLSMYCLRWWKCTAVQRCFSCTLSSLRSSRSTYAELTLYRLMAPSSRPVTSVMLSAWKAKHTTPAGLLTAHMVFHAPDSSTLWILIQPNGIGRAGAALSLRGRHGEGRIDKISLTERGNVVACLAMLCCCCEASMC